MNNHQFRFGKIFIIWLCALLVILVPLFLYSAGDNFLSVVITALPIATIISLLATIISKWIFEARNTYGGLVSERITASGIPELAQNAKSFTGSVLSFLARRHFVIFAIIVLCVNLFFAFNRMCVRDIEDLGMFNFIFFYNFCFFNIPFFLYVILSLFRRKLTPVNRLATYAVLLSVIYLIYNLNRLVLDTPFFCPTYLI